VRRVEVSPAALGSIGLHVAVAIALMISWGARDLKVGSVVPVTIVTKAPAGEPTPAEQATETQAAATEAPVPEAAPTPAPPPQPAPPPAPAPTPAPPKPVEKAPAPTPAPAKPAPARKSLDLDALAASLTKPARNAPPRPSSAARGPTRAETAPVARDTGGVSPAAATALQGLADVLQRRWNPNCNVEGGRDVEVKVSFKLGAYGQVEGKVDGRSPGVRLPDPEDCAGRAGKECVALAAVNRAVAAVYAAAPFKNLPHELYGQRIAVNFNAREACAR
jgi:outer membrane biosynthesis protein TonB